MSQVVWFHNPDAVQTASKISRWWTTAQAEVTVTTSGYDSTRAYTASNTASYLRRLLTGIGEQFGMGCRFYASALPGTAKTLLAPLEGSEVVQVAVVLNTDGTLSIYRGDQTTLLATSSAVVSTGAWHRLGITGLIDRSNGNAEVHLDSTSVTENVVVRVSGTNTSPSDHRTCQGVYVGVSPTLKVGHIYVTGDGRGLIHGARVRYGMSDEVGDLTDWTANTGTQVTAIDETDPDDDTTIITSGVVGDEYANGMAAISEDTAVIHGALVTANVRNYSGSGSPSYDPLIRVGDTTYYGGWQSCSQDEWRAIRYVWGDNPATGMQWTLDEINALQCGGRTLA